MITNRILLAGLAFVSLTVSAYSEFPSQPVWPVPDVPAGQNPATFSVPREDWLIRLQKNLAERKGKQFDLIFDGDSITDGWQQGGKTVWEKYYGSLNAVDVGMSGDKTQNLLWRLNEGLVDDMDPKLVVLMIGTNNVEGIDQVAEGIKAVTAEYLKRCPHCHILLLGIFPRWPKPTDSGRARVIEINKKIAVLASDRITFLDIGAKFLEPDGSISKEIMGDYLHPTTKGYEIWAEAIQPVVDKYLGASNAAKAK